VIAVVLIIQAIIAGLSKWREIRPPKNSNSGKSSNNNVGRTAVMRHQITEIDQRTEAMVLAIESLSKSVRANTQAVERLTARIDDTVP
jgi:hypothetical protein